MKSAVAALRVRRLAKLLQTIETVAKEPSAPTGNLRSLLVDAMREWDAVRKVFDDAGDDASQ
jgi:hypothetical protein